MERSCLAEWSLAEELHSLLLEQPAMRMWGMECCNRLQGLPQNQACTPVSSKSVAESPGCYRLELQAERGHTLVLRTSQGPYTSS